MMNWKRFIWMVKSLKNVLDIPAAVMVKYKTDELP